MVDKLCFHSTILTKKTYYMAGIYSIISNVHKFHKFCILFSGVHHVLSDLLPDSSYYRLNPELSDDFQMDEIRQTSWDKMIHDTQNYCRKKQTDIDNAAKQLLLQKRPDQKVTEWAQRSKTMLWK